MIILLETAVISIFELLANRIRIRFDFSSDSVR